MIIALINRSHLFTFTKNISANLPRPEFISREYDQAIGTMRLTVVVPCLTQLAVGV